MTGGTTLSSSGGAQETSPSVLDNAMEPTETSSTNDYAYGVGQGSAGEY
jgi:nuclear transcription Y subunit beta